MATYDDPAVTYDDLEVLYDGAELGEHVSLIVDGVNVTDELADAPVMVRVGTHGNSLGTLDATLDTPTVTPAVEEAVDYYAGTDRLYRGTIRTVTAEERQDGSVQVSIGAQDAGPDGSLPSAAPFGVSDNADGVTTQEYVSLSRQTRTTEGGSPKTTYQLVMEVDGLQPNQLVEVTSSALGLVAEELEIVDMVSTRLYADQPYYVYTLGDPRVSLAQLVEEHEIPDGSITETKISDGAISTPKLAANAVEAEKIAAGAVETDKLAADAVIANVANVGDTVVIDENGITVTGGAIVVQNPSGDVIIDGTSDMFRIAATGTLSLTLNDGSNGVNTSTVLTALEATETPASLHYLSTSSAASANRHLSVIYNAVGPSQQFTSGTSGGSPTNKFQAIEHIAEGHTNLSGSDPRVELSGHNESSTNTTVYDRYYVLEQTAI